MRSICKIFLLLVFVFLQVRTSAHSFDSLRIEKINGKKFIVHRVDPKETLYSISRRYGSSIDEIFEYNESIESGLKMYAEILVPYSKKKNEKGVKPKGSTRKYHVVAQGETLYGLSRQYNIPVDSIQKMNRLSTVGISIGDTLFLSPDYKTQIAKETIPIEKQKKDSLIYHRVAATETLFGISKQYGVSVEQLALWNKMESYNLEIGQQLIVGKFEIAIVEKKPIEEKPVAVVAKKDPSTDTTYVKTDNSQFKKQTKIVEGKTQITEEGFAMRIEDTDFTTKLLALHKTAPMGALVTVKNQMTGKEIQVHVVGTLPETGLNRNVLIRLSSTAYKQLGALDTKIPITSIYVKD